MLLRRVSLSCRYCLNGEKHVLHINPGRSDRSVPTQKVNCMDNKTYVAVTFHDLLPSSDVNVACWCIVAAVFTHRLVSLMKDWHSYYLLNDSIMQAMQLHTPSILTVYINISMQLRDWLNFLWDKELYARVTRPLLDYSERGLGTRLHDNIIWVLACYHYVLVS